MLEFLKALFLVLHFSFYTLMTFLMIFYVILLSMLMIKLSVLNLMRHHLICGNNKSWLLKLNLIRKTLDWAESGLLISMVEKLNLFYLTSLITLELAVDVKMDGTWGKIINQNIISIAKTASKKIGALSHSMKFLFSETN